MSDHPIVAAVTTLTVATPNGADRTVLAELAALSLQVRAWLDAFDTTLAGCAGDASVVAGDGRRSSRDVSAVAGRAEVCAAMPALHDALASGVVSAGHVDAVARVAGQVEPAVRDALVESASALVGTAAVSSVDWFERHVRDLARRLSDDDGLRQRERIRRQRFLRRWTDRQTGLCHTHVALDPEADARVSAVLDAAVAAERTVREADESRTFDQLRADAFITLATSPRAGGRRPAEVSVLIDYATLADGLHPGSVCETSDGHPVPPETIRRLACDATIIPTVLATDGAVLDHGHGRRVATADQRRALRAMYRTCGSPGCQVRFADCEIHHVTAWIRQRGPTNLDNLLPLCARHHHDVHDGGWQLRLHPDRTITLHHPNGTLTYTGSTIDVAPTGITDLDLITLAHTRIDTLITERDTAAA